MLLILDMNLPPDWVDVLAREGFEARHWSDLGPVTASDAEILTHALAEGAVILTHDLDFGAILAATGGHAPSVVQIRAGDLSPSSIASQVIQALRQTADELARGALVTVDPARARVTLLPLNRDEGQRSPTGT